MDCPKISLTNFYWNMVGIKEKRKRKSKTQILPYRAESTKSLENHLS